MHTNSPLVVGAAISGQALLAGLIVCLIAVAGGLIYLFSNGALQRFTHCGISLSVGILLGDTFLHLLPDAIERLSNPQVVMSGTLAGILLFFLLEKAVRWQQQHTARQTNEPVVKAFASMNLFGDGIHNFIDGMLIAGAFLASPEAGWATTLGIMLHELPQEIGDIGALVAGGYRLRQAVIVNLLCALSCLLGVEVILVAGHWLETYIAYTLPLTAGCFIYIAASDLIPELHRQTARSAFLWQSVFIAIGVGCMASLLLFD